MIDNVHMCMERKSKRKSTKRAQVGDYCNTAKSLVHFQTAPKDNPISLHLRFCRIWDLTCVAIPVLPSITGLQWLLKVWLEALHGSIYRLALSLEYSQQVCS